MSEEKDEKPGFPPINWFGGMLVVRELLLWTKGALEDEDDDGFFAKMNKRNFIDRVALVVSALHGHGLTIEAAKMIQEPAEGCQGFFTDVSAEALFNKISEIVDLLKKSPKFSFRQSELGSLDFTPVESESSDDE